MAKARPKPSDHFVYLYRDASQRPRYVGYGKSPGRAVQLVGRNESFTAFVKKGRFTIEICGPFGSEAQARAAETGLITAIKPDCNRSQGVSRWRFRPLGVPERFAGRLGEPQLSRADLSRAGALLVRINTKKLDDGRLGYDPVKPPSDSAILKRVEAWWLLGRHVREWQKRPGRSPRLLLGIYGGPGSQTVIAALRIDAKGWVDAEPDGGLYCVPTLPTPSLDALHLRGRRIRRSAGIRFGQFRHQNYVVLNR